MTSSKSRIIGGALNLLHDVSNGSNIPGFEPVVNLAVRIYTSAEGAKRNKLESKELACDVHDTVKQILRVFPTLSNDATLETPGLYADGLVKFQRTLERVAAIVERIGQQSRLRRFLNQHDDEEELLRCGKKIMDAKVQFLLLAELAKSDALQRERYPVFAEADLDLLEVLSPTSTVYTKEIARLVPHRKEVVVRRYRNKLRFLEDIEHLSRFRHPNFAFLGASTMMCTSPFVVMEHMVYRPAQEVIENLYHGSPRILQQTALEIVTDVFEGLNHLVERDIPILGFKEQMSSIQYTGRKVILNIDAIPHQPTDSLRTNLGADFHATVVMEIHRQLLIGSLAFYFEFANSYIPQMAAALRPIYQYCHGASVNLDDLRRIREQLRTQSGPLFDLRASLLATGNLEYEIFTHVEADDAVEPGTVAYFDSNAGGRLVAVCNILAELQEHGLASVNPFIAMHTDGKLLIGDDPYEKLIRGRSRFNLAPDVWKFRQTVTVALHDPRATECRLRVQEYFHRNLKSILRQDCCELGDAPAHDFVLVTSVISERTSYPLHTHYGTNPGLSKNQCFRWEDVDRFFNLLPNPLDDGETWGLWTFSHKEVNGPKREYLLEPRQTVYEREMLAFECAPAEF
ncbi:hypothetical protein DFH06DRAFT_1431 [Mycena polygramma]|nr:hypothetical protein DFH06DRAFT_1431 [Mycena polygramma]